MICPATGKPCDYPRCEEICQDEAKRNLETHLSGMEDSIRIIRKVAERYNPTEEERETVRNLWLSLQKIDVKIFHNFRRYQGPLFTDEEIDEIIKDATDDNIQTN